MRASQQVVMRDKITGECKRVDVDYAVLHVITRCQPALSGAAARRRLLAGERFETTLHDFYALPAAWTEVA